MALPRFQKVAGPQEAFELFERYLAEIPAAIERLRALLRRSRDPRFREASLDLNPESLLVLWEYTLLFLDRYRRRSWSQRFFASIGLGRLVVSLNPRDPASLDRVLADPDLVEFLDHVACYLGEVFLKVYPTARRRLGAEGARGRTSLYEHLPVIADLPWEREACPDAIVANLARRALRTEPVLSEARGMLLDALEDYRRPPVGAGPEGRRSAQA